MTLRHKMDGDEEAASVPIGELGILLAQVAVVFSERFQELPRDSQIVHYCSGAGVLVTIVAAVWRRARRAPLLFRLSGVGLPLGIAGDSFVVVRMLFGAMPIAVLIAILVIAISFLPFLSARRS